MTLELIYFAVPRNPALEKRLAATGCAEPRSGDTRKAFLLALSEALAGCSVALTVGEVPHGLALAGAVVVVLGVIAYNVLKARAEKETAAGESGGDGGA